MIIRLNTANFSDNNIGELNKFTIYCHGTGLVSYEANSPVNKGENATITVTTLSSEYDASSIKVTMKGSTITPLITSAGTNKYTFTIESVTGRIEVLVGDVVSGEDVLPTETVWYINDYGAFTQDKDANNLYYGFAYTGDKQASLYRKPINAIKANIKYSGDSGTLKLFKIAADGVTSTLIKTFTITTTGEQILKFDTITLQVGENIAFGEVGVDTARIQFASNANAPNEAFLVKVPSAAQNYVGSPTVNVGYVV